MRFFCADRLLFRNNAIGGTASGWNIFSQRINFPRGANVVSKLKVYFPIQPLTKIPVPVEYRTVAIDNAPFDSNLQAARHFIDRHFVD